MARITDPDALERNRETVAAYSGYAPDYAAATEVTSASGREALERFAQGLPAGGAVFEVGSGRAGTRTSKRPPHGDATDAAPGFVDFQRRRGEAGLFEVIGDEIAGARGIVILYVLQHIDRGSIDAVMRKLGRAPAGGSILHPSRGRGRIDRRSERSASITARCGLRRFRPDHGTGRPRRHRRRVEDEDGRWIVLIATTTR